MNTESGIPVTGLYADEAPSGYIEPPTNTQFHAGVEPEMTLPAAWWNYFVNLFTNTNIKTKEDITAILAELNNALTTMGITPDPEASNQLATLFQNDVLPATFANANMNANPYTTSSLVPKHRGNIAINTTTRTIWLATNTTAAAASWSRLWSPENDGPGSGLDADKVRGTTPGARGLQYLAAALTSNISALILADLKTVDGSGSGLDADLLDGQHGDYYAPKANPEFSGPVKCDDDLEVTGKALIANTFIDTGVYSATQEGFLITTDIPQNANRMTFLEFTMNVHDSGHPCIGIVQCYPYTTGSTILYPRYTAIGNAPSYCRMFYSNSKFCFWFPATGQSNTVHPVLHTSGGGFRILSTTAEALPSQREREVTANVLLPWSSINDGHGSGLDADTVDGSHYNAADILTKLKTVDGSGSGLDADTVDGQHGDYYAPKANPEFTGSPTINGETLTEIIQNITNFGKTTIEEPYYTDQAAFDEASLKAGFHAANGSLVGGPEDLTNDGGSFTMIGKNDTKQLGWHDTHNLFFRSTDTPSASTWSEWYKIWHSGNGGSGSGLDADLLDGQHAGSIKQAVTGIQVRTSDPSNPSDGTIWLRSNV